MKIRVFELGHIGTDCYIVESESSDAALVVDAPAEACDTISRYLETNKRSLSAILLTHPHWDHIWDAAPLAKKTGAKIYASAQALEFIENSDMQRDVLFAPGNFPAAKVDVPVHDGQTFELGGIGVKCMDVPGHCPGSVAYLLSENGESAVFVGDLIFNASVGRTDFYGGDFAALERSIRNKIYTLEDSVVIYPGHGPSTSVGAERRSNPYVFG